ncbi:hypothetical protein EDEG_02332 [Edhazardia aedis USNM 41457]|uniref:Uncharacterized protein n=1 Tax=Edhazardia aedis (strain USNM 41457) TaxID=1003232 RepID=J9D713_EDHAE|nr:hypothetical protein EDEG_02332 [Edhazardia aedis USNM 41457]|eukprot:EJW03324.1 hypothetical protein EDEG_02332 [Edhazardia aedis USNM 41457]
MTKNVLYKRYQNDSYVLGTFLNAINFHEAVFKGFEQLRTLMKDKTLFKEDAEALKKKISERVIFESKKLFLINSITKDAVKPEKIASNSFLNAFIYYKSMILLQDF